jgi:glucose/mannose-6-phosphate isomerase
MRRLIEEFPNHIQDALKIGEESKISSATGISNVIVCGLGGSGIGGTVVSRFVQSDCPVPMLVNNNYQLPSFAGENTLVIVSSYSGNTEETVSSLKEAISIGCHVVCITSGGQVQELASENGLDLIMIPPGNPPRSMFAYSTIQILYVLNAFGLIDASFVQDLKECAEHLRSKQKDIEASAGEVAKSISGRLPVIYAESRLEGVAVRWRQQFNENSKMLGWSNVFPEMNHNELVGWDTAGNNIAVLLLKDGNEYGRNTLRQDICSDIFRKKCDTILNIVADSGPDISRIFELIHIGDWISLILAENRGIDPDSIDNINLLKSELNKIP